MKLSSKERTFDVSGFSVAGTLISVSAASHRARLRKVAVRPMIRSVVWVAAKARFISVTLRQLKAQ